MKELDSVILLREVEAVPIKAGTRGAIVYMDSRFPDEIIVEFVDGRGGYLGYFPISTKDVELVKVFDPPNGAGKGS